MWMLTTGILRIRESKFHRSRWVPLSPDACLELRAYLRQRLKAPYDQRPTAPFLCNGSSSYGRVGWHAYTGAAIWQGFRTLFDKAGIRDAQGRCRWLHVTRQNYAVRGTGSRTRLRRQVMYKLIGRSSRCTWDTCPSSRRPILHFIPEVAALACERFNRRYAHVIGPGVP